MTVGRASALCTLFAWTTFAEVLPLGDCLAQERGSLVTTRLEVAGEVRRKDARLHSARFAEFVMSREGQEIIARHGFTPVAR